MKLSGEDVKEQIYKLAKKGLSPSQIGNHGDDDVLFFNLSLN